MTTEQNAQLIKETLAELNDERVRKFKADAKAKILAIAEKQNQMAKLLADVQQLKKELKELILEELKVVLD